MKIARVIDVSACRNASEILQTSDTDWCPTAVKLDTLGPNPRGLQAILRPDNGALFGTVGDRYTVRDHRESIVELDALIRMGDIRPVSVSVWDNGACLAYQFGVNGSHANGQLGGVETFLTLASWHDGKGAERCFFSDFRWFCKNQMGAVNAAEGSDVRIRHSATVAGRFADTLQERIRSLSAGEIAKRRAQYVRMMSHGFAPKNLLQWTADALEIPVDASGERSDRIMAPLLAAYAADDCNAPNTLWHAYNAATRVLTHEGRNQANVTYDATLGRRASLASGVYDRAVKLLGSG
jgi:hypothetical protein